MPTLPRVMTAHGFCLEIGDTNIPGQICHEFCIRCEMKERSCLALLETSACQASSSSSSTTVGSMPVGV